MRLFTAIPLPKETSDGFAELAKGKLPIPYINTGNFHVTLNFLGDLDTDQVVQAKQIWAELPEFKKIRIEFDQLIKFRQQIHLTIKPNKPLSNLQQILETNFKSAGLHVQDREYYAHVKIGNLHMDKVMNRGRKIENFPNEQLKNLSFTAEKIILFESKLLLHHAHHIPLAEINLA